MAYLIILGIVIVGLAVIFVWVAKRALTPKDVYTDPRSTSMAPIMRCRHCDAVVTHRNIDQHGPNCPKRPAPSSS